MVCVAETSRARGALEHAGHRRGSAMKACRAHIKRNNISAAPRLHASPDIVKRYGGLRMVTLWGHTVAQHGNVMGALGERYNVGNSG